MGLAEQQERSRCQAVIPASERLDLSWKLCLLMSSLLNQPASTSGTSLQKTDKMFILLFECEMVGVLLRSFFRSCIIHGQPSFYTHHAVQEESRAVYLTTAVTQGPDFSILAVGDAKANQTDQGDHTSFPRPCFGIQQPVGGDISTSSAPGEPSLQQGPFQSQRGII